MNTVECLGACAESRDGGLMGLLSGRYLLGCRSLFQDRTQINYLVRAAFLVGREVPQSRKGWIYRTGGSQDKGRLRGTDVGRKAALLRMTQPSKLPIHPELFAAGPWVTVLWGTQRGIHPTCLFEFTTSLEIPHWPHILGDWGCGLGRAWNMESAEERLTD